MPFSINITYAKLRLSCHIEPEFNLINIIFASYRQMDKLLKLSEKRILGRHKVMVRHTE
jgi:hypothetical protein